MLPALPLAKNSIFIFLKDEFKCQCRVKYTPWITTSHKRLVFRELPTQQVITWFSQVSVSSSSNTSRGPVDKQGTTLSDWLHAPNWEPHAVHCVINMDAHTDRKLPTLLSEVLGGPCGFSSPRAWWKVLKVEESCAYLIWVLFVFCWSLHACLPWCLHCVGLVV